MPTGSNGQLVAPADPALVKKVAIDLYLRPKDAPDLADDKLRLVRLTRKMVAPWSLWTYYVETSSTYSKIAFASSTRVFQRRESSSRRCGSGENGLDKRNPVPSASNARPRPASAQVSTKVGELTSGVTCWAALL